MAFSTPREIARDFVYMSFARTISLGISFARSLVIPGLLGPLAYGIWKTVDLVQAYAQFGDLGARAALKREIPYHAGRGDAAGLASSRDVAFTADNISVLIAAVCTLVAALLVEDRVLRAALILSLPLLYVSHINSFMEQVLYASKQFAFTSRLSVGMGVLEAALAIGMTWAMGLPGLILGTTAAYLVGTFLQIRHTGYSVRFRWSWERLKQLVSVGFPSHLNGLLYNIFHSIDRWLILSFLGLTSFGYYAFGMTVNDYLFQFSYTLGNIISPRLVERYSQRERLEDLRPMVEMPLLIISRVAPVVLGSVFFASELVVRVLLPSFEEGLVPLQILLVGTYFSSVPRGLSSFFITLRRQAQTVHLYLLSILGNGLIVWWLLASGYGLAGAAAGTTISLAFFGYGLIVLALRYFMGVKELLVELAKLTWPLGLGVALALIARHAGSILAGPGEGLYAVVAGSILGGALFLAAYSPVVWHLYRAYGSQLRAPAVDEEVSQA